MIIGSFQDYEGLLNQLAEKFLASCERPTPFALPNFVAEIDHALVASLLGYRKQVSPSWELEQWESLAALFPDSKSSDGALLVLLTTDIQKIIRRIETRELNQKYSTKESLFQNNPDLTEESVIYKNELIKVDSFKQVDWFVYRDGGNFLHLDPRLDPRIIDIVAEFSPMSPKLVRILGEEPKLSPGQTESKFLWWLLPPCRPDRCGEATPQDEGEAKIEGVRKLQWQGTYRRNKGYFSYLLEELIVPNLDEERCIGRMLHFDFQGKANCNLDALSPALLLQHLDLALNYYDGDAATRRLTHGHWERPFESATDRTHLFRTHSIPLWQMPLIAQIFFKSITSLCQWLPPIRKFRELPTTKRFE